MLSHASDRHRAFKHLHTPAARGARPTLVSGFSPGCSQMNVGSPASLPASRPNYTTPHSRALSGPSGRTRGAVEGRALEPPEQRRSVGQVRSMRVHVGAFADRTSKHPLTRSSVTSPVPANQGLAVAPTQFLPRLENAHGEATSSLPRGYRSAAGMDFGGLLPAASFSFTPHGRLPCLLARPSRREAGPSLSGGSHGSLSSRLRHRRRPRRLEDG